MKLVTITAFVAGAANAVSAAAIERRVDTYAFEAPSSKDPFYQYGKGFTFVNPTSIPGAPAKGGFKLRTDQLANSWDVIKSSASFKIQKGSDIKNKNPVCENLPLQYSTTYKTAFLPAESVPEIKGIAISNLPYYKQANGDAFGTDLGSLSGLCVAYNKDAIMFSVSPAFPSTPIAGMTHVDPTKPMKVAVGGFGLAWKSPALNYTHKNMNLWTGVDTLTPKASSFGSNLWTNFGIEARFTNSCPQCKMVASVAAFTNGAPGAAVQFSGINVEDIGLDFGLLPQINFANAFGVWRNDETNPLIGNDNVCKPSGLFFQLKQEISIPSINSALRKYVGFKGGVSSEKPPIDAYVAFRPVDGMNGAGLRFTKDVSILNYKLGTAQIEMQYITPREFDRRRKYYGKANPCKITCARYDGDLCTDPKSGIRTIDQLILQNQQLGDYVMLSAEYKSKLNFIGSFLLSIDKATFFFASSTKDVTNSVMFYLYGRLKVLFLETDLTIQSISDQLYFKTTTDIELVKFTIEGRADLSSSLVTSAVGRPLDQTPWSINVSGALQGFLRNAEKFVSTEVNAFAKFASKTWKKVKGKIEDLANEIEDLFLGKNAPLAFLAPEFRTVVKVGEKVVDKLKDFGGKAEDFGKSELRTLADCGESLIHGDFKGALKSMKKILSDDVVEDGFNALFGDSVETSLQSSPGKDKYGCGMKKVKTTSCERIFGIKHDCTTRYGKPFSDPECLKKVLRAAADVRSKSSKAATLKQKLDDSKSQLPAVVEIAKDIDAGKPFELPAGSIDPLVLNLDSSNPAASNIISNYAPVIKASAVQLSKAGGKTTNMQPVTYTLAPFKLGGQGVDQAYLKNHFISQQSVFNNKLKNFVMNGQTQIDDTLVKA
ncbi:hypothetical protein HDU97_004277 [Phlyctochytrium planicorne]|nr:hypothetical protein HDU97_004277 [Phlyctochytrium planicorne]